MDIDSTYKIGRVLASYRANPDIFPKESKDSKRTQQISQLPMLNWEKSAKEFFQKPELLIVIDTEFFLMNMKLTAELFDRVPVVVPWIVVQELDALKNSDEWLNNVGKCVGDVALEGIMLLLHLLNNNHPMIVGQQLNEYHSVTHLNIDRIVDCAVYYKDKITKFLVLLASNRDISSKALSHQLYVISEWSSSSESLLSTILKEFTAPSNVSTSTKNALTEISAACLNVLISYLPHTIEYYLTEEFGSDFDLVIAVQPPWTLQNMIYLIRKHWVSVFRDKFSSTNKRDSEESLKRIESFCKRWESIGGSYLLFNSSVSNSEGVGKYTRVSSTCFRGNSDLKADEVKRFITDIKNLINGFEYLRQQCPTQLRQIESVLENFP